MENQHTGEPSIFNDGQRESLPNATAVLVLGIVSIVGCFCYGIVGITCGIIALVLGKKDKARYAVNPGRYTPASYNNLKAGRVCAIVGLSLSAIYLVIIIFYIAIVGTIIFTHPDALWHHYSSYN